MKVSALWFCLVQEYRASIFGHHALTSLSKGLSKEV